MRNREQLSFSNIPELLEINKAKIHEQRKIIRSTILNFYMNLKIITNIPFLHSIYLCGGLTRLEAFVFNGQMISDLDIIIATRIPALLYFPFTKKVERNIEASCNLRLVEILPIEARKFSLLPKRIFYYDFKQSGICLFGQDLRSNIPIFNSTQIYYEDFIRLLLNRLEGLLHCFKQDQDKLIFISRETALKEINKAFLAYFHFLLFKKKIYSPNLKKTVNKVIKEKKIVFKCQTYEEKILEEWVTRAIISKFVSLNNEFIPTPKEFWEAFHLISTILQRIVNENWNFVSTSKYTNYFKALFLYHHLKPPFGLESKNRSSLILFFLLNSVKEEGTLHFENNERINAIFKQNPSGNGLFQQLQTSKISFGNFWNQIKNQLIKYWVAGE